MTEPNADARLPGMTVQHTFLLEELLAQLIGTLDIDPATNCLVVRVQVSRLDDKLGIVPAEHLVDVAWPLGSTIAIRDNKPALLDATGQTIAHVGDEVSVGGGSVPTTTANVVPCTGQDHVFVGHHPRRL
ncbi:hypothetical protein ACFWUU_01060 [Kribbella sp. NPDC058693]|uniref:hypothetical protein n=1 Tax=Kribbella sp. NPDC058693 TaxID=3346602 RepID=UPI00364F8E2E